MAAATSWSKMTLQEKLISAGIDIMNHKEFALLSGCVVMGKMEILKQVPTAGTNGRDEWFNKEFMEAQSRKQIRWIRIHENLHKAGHHCTDFKLMLEQYGMLGNMAQDFVVNAFINELDPQHAFCEPPSNIDGTPFPICLDKKYYGWSCIEVLRDIMKNVRFVKRSSAGKGGFDEHKPGDQEMTPEEQKALKDDVDNALRQGRIICERLAGNEKGGNPLDNIVKQRYTNWREQLRQWFAQFIKGWEQSRYCPPNKRLLPWCIMPSHFSEVTGELIIACDTSGSMGGVYPIVFGEVVRIIEDVQPELVRLLWWDTAVCSEQVFLPKDYDNIAKVLKPEGGGGTTPGVVGNYIKKKNYKPKAVIMLTDGYIDSSWTHIESEVLWGVLDNDHFDCPQGKTIHLYSDAL